MICAQQLHADTKEPEITAAVMKVIAQIIVIALNYILSKLWIFKKK